MATKHSSRRRRARAVKPTSKDDLGDLLAEFLKALALLRTIASSFVTYIQQYQLGSLKGATLDELSGYEELYLAIERCGALMTTILPPS
jgi:hypothetical protein